MKAGSAHLAGFKKLLAVTMCARIRLAFDEAQTAGERFCGLIRRASINTKPVRLAMMFLVVGCSPILRELPQASTPELPASCERWSEASITTASLLGISDVGQSSQVPALVFTRDKQDLLVVLSFEPSTTPARLAKLRLSDLQLQAAFQIAPLDKALARFNTDGTTLAAAVMSPDQPNNLQIQAWDTVTGSLLSRSKPVFMNLSEVYDLALSPNGEWILFDERGSIGLTNLADLEGGRGYVTTTFEASRVTAALAFDRTGKLFALGRHYERQDGSRIYDEIELQTWDGVNVSNVKDLPPVTKLGSYEIGASYFPLDEPALRLAFDPTNHWLAILSANGIQLRDLVDLDYSKKAQASLPESAPRVVGFNPSGSLLAAGHSLGLKVLRVPDLSVVLDKPGSEVTSVAYSPDGCLLAWGDTAGTVHIIQSPTR